MNKINWKQKLTSRKFWAAFTGFITAVMVILRVDKLTMEQVISLVSAMSVLVAYIIGEGMSDTARINTKNYGQGTTDTSDKNGNTNRPEV